MESDRTLVIIGAGFSVPAGLPVTSAIWNFAENLHPSALHSFIAGYRRWSPNIFPLLFPLQDSQIPTIRDCIGQIEPLLQALGAISGPLRESDAEHLHMKLLKGLAWPSLSRGISPQVAPLPIAMFYRILFETLTQRYEKLPYDDPSHNEIIAPLSAVYAQFCSTLPSNSLIVSTNYDDILERALLNSGRRWDYGVSVLYHEAVEMTRESSPSGSFYRWSGTMDIEGLYGGGTLIWARLDWRPPNFEGSPDIIVYKPHGSLRWLQCYDCTRTYSVDFWAAFATNFVGLENPLFEELFFRCWDHECHFSPTIPIALPIEGKEFEAPILGLQWKNIEAESEHCGRLIIIGSALRLSDERLINIVMQAAKTARSIIVIDPSPETASRLEEMSQKKVDRFRSLQEYADSFS